MCSECIYPSCRHLQTIIVTGCSTAYILTLPRRNLKSRNIFQNLQIAKCYAKNSYLRQFQFIKFKTDVTIVNSDLKFALGKFSEPCTCRIDIFSSSNSLLSGVDVRPAPLIKKLMHPSKLEYILYCQEGHEMYLNISRNIGG